MQQTLHLIAIVMRKWPTSDQLLAQPIIEAAVYLVVDKRKRQFEVRSLKFTLQSIVVVGYGKSNNLNITRLIVMYIHCSVIIATSQELYVFEITSVNISRC